MNLINLRHMSLGNKSYISKFYMFCNSLVVGGDQNSEQNFKIAHFTEMEFHEKNMVPS